MRYYSSTATAKTLGAAVTTSSTTIQLSDLTGLPASYPYTLVLDPDTASEEIVLVTSLSSGTVLNVTRGSDTSGGITGGDGTSKKAHDSGATVKHMVTARDVQEPQTHMAASSGVHGLTGSVVGTSDTQTLSNKTLTSPTATGTTTVSALTATGTVTLPSTTSIGNVSSTEIGYLDGVTSAIQTQFDAKAPKATPVFTGTVYFAQGAPTAKSSATTLTIAELLTGIIDTGGGSGFQLTLPTGTNVEGGVVSGLANDSAFDWSIINRGGGAVTVAGNTNHTFSNTGSATVAIGSSGLFRTRKTATNTYTTYRIA